MYSKIFNLSLRALTLGSRFLFVFVLAKLMTPEEIGVYGLIVVSVSYALYLVGVDFYTFTTRKFIELDRSGWGYVIKNQGALALLLYSIVIPACLLLFYYEFLPWSVAIWFLILLVLEHLCQELGRFFVAINEQVFSSGLLFVRQGLWPVILVVVMYFHEDSRGLSSVLMFWAAFSLLAVCMGFERIRRLGIGGWSEPISWRWIRGGVLVAIPLLLASLAVRGIFTFDRYWLSAAVDMQAVGAYVLYSSVCGALIIFLDASVYAYQYPAMIRAYQNGESDGFTGLFGKTLMQAFVVTFLYVCISYLVLPILLTWIGNVVYEDYRYFFYWIMIAMVMNGFSLVPHFSLYAQKNDRPIMWSHIGSLIVFIGVTAILLKVKGEVAVLIGLVSSQAWLLVTKTVLYYVLTERKYRWVPFANKADVS